MKLQNRQVARSLASVASVLMVAAMLATSARATEVIFTIDPAQSTTSWTGVDAALGAWSAQSPGSDSAVTSGHFLVDFDPLSNTPTSLQFIGGHGYYQLASSNSGLPGPGGSNTPAPANIAIQAGGGSLQYAIRNLSWDFNSPPTALSAGSMPASSATFTVNSADWETNDHGSKESGSYAGQSDQPTAGTFTLIKTGSGDWKLQLAGTYDYNYTANVSNGTFTTHANITATAHFGEDNIVNVPAPSGAPVEVDALGGAGTTGGVSAEINQNATGGTLTVQQVPNSSSLSQAAIDAAATNPIFALSTADVGVAPQIWEVNYSGSLNGGTATLLFHYDPALLPPGMDESQLVIWHFNKISGQWEKGGIVDTTAHTISFETSSFSPFQLGVNVPEPSSVVLAGLGLVGLAIAVWRRRRRGI